MTDLNPCPQSPGETFDFTDICDFFIAICTAAERFGKPVVQKNHQGKTTFDSWIGFTVDDLWFRLQHYSVRCTLMPLRPYVTTTADRDKLAERITEDPKGVLQEMINSGGWHQVNPSDAMALTLAACVGPAGNPVEQQLREFLGGRPKPH